jgi:hypothetical protein
VEQLKETVKNQQMIINQLKTAANNKVTRCDIGPSFNDSLVNKKQ